MTVALTPPPLDITELRCVYRSAAEVRLPLSAGKILRNALGQALQRVSCPVECHGAAASCQAATLCSYRALYEGQRSDAIRRSMEPPRPYTVVAPPPQPLQIRAGGLLECGLRLFGRARSFLPIVIAALEELGRGGLGVYRVPLRLESVELIRPDQPFGPIIGGAAGAGGSAPISGYNLAETPRLAATYLPALELELISHLRLPHVSGPAHQLQFSDLIWAICRRLEDLNSSYGEHPWRAPLAELLAESAVVRTDTRRLRWEAREAVSLRHDQKNAYQYSGLIGTVGLSNVSHNIRSFLLAGSLIHVGKYTVQGNGRFLVHGERLRGLE